MLHLHAFLRLVFWIKLMLEFVLSELYCNQYFDITYIGYKQIEKLAKENNQSHRAYSMKIKLSKISSKLMLDKTDNRQC